MVLGRKARPPLRIRLTKKRLALLFILAFVFIASFLVMTVLVANFWFETAKSKAQRQSLISQNARLIERGREKDRQMAQLSDKMRAIELTLERVEQMEGKVKILSGLPEQSLLIRRPGPATPRITGEASQAQVSLMFASASDLLSRMDIQQASLRRTARWFMQQRSAILQIPSFWPIKGWVTSLFGIRESPFTGQKDMHNGLDIAAPEGAVIRAPAAGEVIYIGSEGGYGNVLILQHGRGISTLYGHLARSLVEQGDSIPVGAPIALVGNTGRSTGPHLHYEVRINNIPVNPMRFLPEQPQEKTETEQPAQAPSTPEPSLAPQWPSEPAMPEKPKYLPLIDENQ